MNERNERRSDERLLKRAVTDDTKGVLFGAMNVDLVAHRGRLIPTARGARAAVRLVLDEFGIADGKGRTYSERAARRLWPLLERYRHEADERTRREVFRLFVSGYRKRRKPVVVDGDAICETAGHIPADVRDAKGRHPFRSTAAVELQRLGWDQEDIAEYLNVQQPAVSKLLSRAA